ncbi:MAG: zinc-ribbon domain-containing protein [Candidatus Eisenbacteria bacterium]|uniref:Zinc-ribbon domain-containing protein n=1 Tax=Eiseniibacteriota bacterium TaxID=2212470 RepID=A0A849STA2_UNCEI|nr:zinc-ribbon domain-containing protein [Candidatus Eisenbacteria bacterium]
MFCSRCGREVQPNAIYCSNCGAALAPTGAPIMAAEPFAAVQPVVTAEPLATSPRYAGFWRRFFALWVDSLLLCVLQLPVSLTIGQDLPFLFGSNGLPDFDALTASIGALALTNACTLLISWLYYALLESSATQATLGKLLLGVRVTDLEGRRIGFGRASLRWLARFVSNLTFGIGYVMAAFTSRRQTLHDLMTNTLVVKGRP